jgi:hypothetical protein
MDNNNIIDLINGTKGELEGKAWHKILLKRPRNI